MSTGTAAHERRDAFIHDIVEVCKKHRVMIQPEGGEFEGADVLDLTFSEFNDSETIEFYVQLEDLEDEIRRAVWPIVHGV